MDHGKYVALFAMGIICSTNSIAHAIDLPCQLFTYSFCPWQTYFLIAIANLHPSPWQFYFHIHSNFYLHRSRQMYIYVAWQVYFYFATSKILYIHSKFFCLFRLFIGIFTSINSGTFTFTKHGNYY